MWVQSLFTLLPQLKKIIKIGLLYTLCIELVKLAPPYLLKIAIDLLIDPHPVLWQVLSVIFTILIVSLLSTFIEDRFLIFNARSAFNVETSILRRGHEKLMQLGLSYHEKHPSGDLVQLMNKGSVRLMDMMWFLLDQFLGATMQILLTSILLLIVNFWCGLVFVLFMPIVIYMVHRTGQKMQPYRREYHSVFRRASWEMNQSLMNVRTVKDFVQEESERQKYDELLDKYLTLAERRMQIENEDTRLRDIVLSTARFSVLFYAVYLVFAGAMTPGTLYLFATLSEKVIASLFRLGRLYNHLGDSMESIQQFTALFKQTPDIKEVQSPINCASLKGEITFERVSFAYGAVQPILRDVDLRIPAKSVLALVGRSGAGKSTVIKLLSRHYDVSAGSIKVDGIDIRQYSLDQYRRKIAIVSQDVQIFDTSIKQNIAYGSRSSFEAIQEVARLAYAHEFIEGLPDGYETIVGERGLRLSGGQRQRIGIARALLVEPAVLIFDEATSSLDTESERLIQDALRQIAHKQTMILIAHRLSTIENADLIAVMDQGQIVEVGSHQELMERGGLFAHMRHLQTLGELRP